MHFIETYGNRELESKHGHLTDLVLAEKQLFQYSLTIWLFLRHSMLHFSPEVSMLLRKFIHTGSFIQPTAVTIHFLLNPSQIPL